MEIDGIKKICVVGAGTMGHQIALQFAVHNFEVHLVDTSKEALKNAQEEIKNVLKGRTNRHEITSDSMEKALSRIRCATDLEKKAADADFIIEAVFEDVNVKRQVFGELDRICHPHAILATNSSSISVLS